MIYVDEAHPVEQNDFPPETGSLQMHLPQTIEQRMENASVLATMTSVPVYVDTLENIGESLYGAHPERLYIIQGGKIVMKGGEGPLNYKLEDAADWLQDHFRMVISFNVANRYVAVCSNASNGRHICFNCNWISNVFLVYSAMR